jgi:hypothetical protein
MNFTDFQMKVVHHASDLPGTWDSFVSENNRWYSKSDLQAFEELGNYQQLYAWLEDERGMLAAMCLQLVDFKGEQLDSYFPKSTSLPSSIRNNAARLVLHTVKWRMLVVNNILITGSKPFALRSGTENPHELLNHLASRVASEQGADIVLFGDWYQKDIDRLGDLKDLGFARFATEDEMRVDLRESWNRFDDYLSALQSKYRVRYRNFAKKGQSVERRLLTLEEIRMQSDRLDQLFRQVEETAGFALVSPSADYFLRMKESFGEKFQVQAYFNACDLIAFSSFIVHPEKLETHFIGIDYKVNQHFALFPNILYDAVQLGIEWEKKSVGFGRTAPEIKSTVGADPTPMYGYLKHKSAVGQMIVHFFSNYLKPKSWIQRKPFKA